MTWLKNWLRLEPHQIIGGNNPYLKRWYVIPKNRLLNIYLHQFLRSDDDRALHDHPWWFASYILKGGYWEHRKGKLITTRSYRQSGSIAFRRPTAAHRIELDVANVADHPDGSWGTYEKPVWTVVVTGPRIRRWGFHCPKGWIHWKQFDVQNGCGEA